MTGAESAISADRSLVRDYAHKYAAEGLRVHPVKAGVKEPVFGKWPDLASRDIDTINGWFIGRRNIGIALGEWGNDGWLVAIDIDTKNGDGYTELKKLTDEHGALPVTWEQQTQSGGCHLIFRSPTEIGNSDKKLAPNIDVKGARGQIIAAPSRCELGTYRWVKGRAPWERPIADLPDWLHQKLVELTTPPPPKQRDPLPTNNHHDSPLDRLRDNWDWATELTKDGWQHTRQNGEDSYWTRPGKNKRDGHSAVLHGNDCFVVFTTELTDAQRRAGTETRSGTITFSPAQWLAARNHNGDITALTRDLKASETPPESPTSDNDSDDPDPYTPTIDESFLRVDLAPILAGDYQQPEPTILRCDNGDALFYPAEVNFLYGDGGHGKGWVSLYAIHQEISKGNTCIFIDAEDNANSICARLAHIGAKPDDILNYLSYHRPQDPFLKHNVEYIRQLAIEHTATLIVIDSLGECFGIEGVNEDSDYEVAPWLRRVPRKLADTGAAVIVIDHVTHSQNTRNRPSGSKRKRAATTGTMIRVDAIQAPTKEDDGRISLTCYKDRHGNYQAGQRVADFNMIHHFGDLHIELRRTDQPARQPADHQIVARHVTNLLRDNGDMSRNQIEKAITADPSLTVGRDKTRRGIDLALQLGTIQETAGARNARIYSFVAEMKK